MVALVKHRVHKDKEEGSSEYECGKYQIAVLSEKPRVVLIHNFLSEEKCDHLITLARPHLARSKLGSTINPDGVISRARTSRGTYLYRGEDTIVRDIETRIADFLLIPVERGEDLQVLHYAKGQKFDPHVDYFSTDIPENGGQRIATLLMYLSDVKQGGETVFPNAKGKGKFRDPKKGGLVVKPKKGTALLFWNTLPDGTVDPLRMHGGSPVKQGDKWVCAKWIRASEFKCDCDLFVLEPI